MTKIIKTRGIILNTRNFKESSLFASVLTHNHGRIQILAKGCRRPRSKLCGTMERLNFNEIIFYKREEKDTYNLSDAVIIDDFYKLRMDPRRVNASLVMSEFFDKTLALEQSDERSFALMLSFLKKIQNINDSNLRLCVYITLLQAIVIAGIRPHLEDCVRCKAAINLDQPKIDFSTLGGGLVCHRDHDETVISLKSSTVRNMHLLFRQKKYAFGPEVCDEFRNLIPEYLFHHFDRLTLHTLKYL